MRITARELDFGRMLGLWRNPFLLFFLNLRPNLPRKMWLLLIADSRNSSSQTWYLKIRRRLFDTEIPRQAEFTERLKACQIGNGNDRKLWRINSSGIFSTKSAFYSLISRLAKLKAPWWTIFGSLKLQRKLRFFCGLSRPEG